MPDISITDELGTPAEGVKIDPSQPSSLAAYAGSQLLHLLVVPDFLARVGQPLSQAAPESIQFQSTVANGFQLGASQPAITLTAKGQAVLRADATHAGLEVTGTVSVGASIPAADFSFGLNATAGVTIGFDKSFSGAAVEPTFGAAMGQMLSGFVIPASVGDLAMLAVGDVSAVAGQGSLKVSGSFSIAAAVNPLASVKLPLNVGAIDVKDGAMAGVSASLTISGAYKIRACGLAGGAVGLRFEKQSGTTLRAGISASAGVSVQVLGKDLLSPLMGAITRSGSDPKLLEGLTAAELAKFNDALQDGVDLSVQASLDLALSTAESDDAIFEYEIRPGALDAASTAAVNRALHGDLTALTELEAPAGVTLRSSVLTRMQTTGVTLKVNLLGIVNLISMSKLIDKCEILSDPASGAVTIKETATGEHISAISDPVARQEALRKAIFESVLVTTTYRASGVVAMPELHCANLHFVVNRDTNASTVRNYLNWFAALNLIARGDIAEEFAGYTGDKTSSCLLRTELDDAACENLFFSGGKLREEVYYREFARHALRALLHPEDDEIEAARYRVLDDPATWAHAVRLGPSDELRHLISLGEANPRFNQALLDVRGDVYDIAWWAESMTKAGKELETMRQFLKGRDPVGLKDDAEFQRRRAALQDVMLKVVAKSQARFGEPWGMVSLFWSAGSPAGASGRLRAGNWSVVRP